MQHKTSQDLFSYWNEVRGSRPAPNRFEIEPVKIAASLPETFVLERKDFQTYPFRLAGTRLCQHFQTEFRGRNFLEGWSSIDRLILERALSAAAQDGGVVVAQVTAHPSERTRHATFEIIILPLMHLHPKADRFLGGWSAIDQPSWLGGEPIVSCTITACDVISPDGQERSIPTTQDRQAPFRAHIRSGRLVNVEGRNFRVYDGGLLEPQKDDA